MVKDNHLILAVHVSNRVVQAEQVQKTISEYGCSIKTRLGLHEASEGYCSPEGIMILELTNNEETMIEFRDKLNAITGVEAKEIVFSH